MRKPGEISIGNFRFDPVSRDLRDRSGQRIGLRNKSSEVLACLAAKPGEIVTKTEIMEAVWPDVVVTDESLTQCIADIRRAIGDKDQTLLATHVGKGYSLAPAPTWRAWRAPKPVWALVGIAVLVSGLLAWIWWPKPVADGPPRIAILAFDDLSAGEDRGYLSDGIAEGIITELASYHELEVIARNSSFSFRDTDTDIRDIARQLRADFVLEGSKQKSGERLRLTVQLINGHDGTHLWAHEYDAEIGDLFDVQSRIVRSVATHLGHELAWKAPESGGRDKVSALHYYLRGNSEFTKSTRESTLAARDLYLQAIEADPAAPFGYVGMSLIFWHDSSQRWVYPDMSREEILRQGTEFADKALAIDRNYYAAHIARGDMHFIAGEHEDAIIRYRNASELNPASGQALALPNDSLIYLDRADEAVALMKRAIDINPITPGWYYKNLAHALWATGDCAEGIQWMKKRSRLRPWDLRTLMVLQACNGDLDDARETVARHQDAEPDYTVRTYDERNRDVWNNPDLLERWLNDMRLAGMPEG